MSSVKKIIFPKRNSDKNNVEQKTVLYGFRVLVALVSVGAVVFLFPISSIYQPLNLPPEGSLAKEELVAPFTFPILKSDQELQQNKEMVISSLPVILDYHPAIWDSIAREVRAFFVQVDSINRDNRVPGSRIRGMRVAFPGLEEEGIFLLSTGEDLETFQSDLVDVLKDFYQAGIAEKVEDLPFQDNRKAVILEKGNEISISEDDLLDISKARERLLSLALVEFEAAGRPVDMLVPVVVWTILFSVIARGLSANPLAARYARRLEATRRSQPDLAELADLSELRKRRHILSGQPSKLSRD